MSGGWGEAQGGRGKGQYQYQCQCQFNLHFTCSLRAVILLPKNFKAKMLVEKSCAKYFRSKKAQVKFWWNWHLREGETKKCHVKFEWLQYNVKKDQNTTKVESYSFDHVENAEHLKNVFYPKKNCTPSTAIVLKII